MIVAEMYFRVQVDKIVHERQVFGFMDWLGSIGGIESMLIEFLIFFFGAFTQFNAVIATFNTFMSYKHSKSMPETI